MSMTHTELTIVRHGETEWNLEGRQPGDGDLQAHALSVCGGGEGMKSDDKKLSKEILPHGFWLFGRVV